MGILKKMQFVQRVSFDECYHYFFIHIKDFVSALIKEDTAQEKVLLEIFKAFLKRRKKRGYDREESTKEELYMLAREKCLAYIQGNPAVNRKVAALLQTDTVENVEDYLVGMQVKAEKRREFINTLRSLVFNKKKDEKIG